jgi:hypothetical protein
MGNYNTTGRTGLEDKTVEEWMTVLALLACQKSN